MIFLKESRGIGFGYLEKPSVKARRKKNPNISREQQPEQAGKFPP